MISSLLHTDRARLAWVRLAGPMLGGCLASAVPVAGAQSVDCTLRVPACVTTCAAQVPWLTSSKDAHKALRECRSRCDAERIKCEKEQQSTTSVPPGKPAEPVPAGTAAGDAPVSVPIPSAEPMPRTGFAATTVDARPSSAATTADARPSSAATAADAEVTQARAATAESTPLGALDVVGIELGMSIGAAIERIKAHDGRLSIQELHNRHMVGLLGHSPVVGVLARSATRSGNPDQTFEQIQLDAAPGGPTPVVTGIHRMLQLAAAERPTIATVVAGLEAKYGRPTRRQSSSNRTILWWLFDRKGRPLEAAACNESGIDVRTGNRDADIQFAHIIGEAVANGPSQRGALWTRLAESCPQTVVAVVNSSNAAPGVAAHVDVIAVDFAARMERLDAAVAQARQRKQAASDQQAQQANAQRDAAARAAQQRPTPKF